MTTSPLLVHDDPAPETFLPSLEALLIEEGLTSHYRHAEVSDVEEERRLFYVGLTRTLVSPAPGPGCC